MVQLLQHEFQTSKALEILATNKIEELKNKFNK